MRDPEILLQGPGGTANTRLLFLPPLLYLHSNPHGKSCLTDSRQPQSGLWVPEKGTDFPLAAPPENSHFLPSSDWVLSILTSTEELVVLPCSRFRGMQ